MSVPSPWKAGEASKEAALELMEKQGSTGPTFEQRKLAVKELLLNGKLSKHLQPPEIFRMVIGGHGWDFNAERYVLHTSVLPDLCR